MPYPILVALVLAFGLDLDTKGGPMTRGEVSRSAIAVLGGVGMVGAISFLIGLGIAFRVGRTGYVTPAVRRSLSWGGRLIEALGLIVFAWTIYEVHWPRTVEWGLGLRDTILADEVLILLPFLVAQVLGWWGLYAGERAVRYTPPPPVGRYLILKSRQALGVILPVGLIYTFGHDILRTRFPGLSADPWARLVGLSLMGVLVMVLAPAFVRLAWPTRPMPAGPLRDRLERMAGRLRFRYTDLLVWDTGGTVVNAGVTGAVPWFRYILITDGMLVGLGEREIEAVFGHEIGHIAHRHLVYFLFFFMGSMGVLALAAWGLDHLLPASAGFWNWLGDSDAENLLREGIFVGVLAAYFVVIFGIISRRFERQADVFGCRAVSCGRDDCPPHADVNASRDYLPPSPEICPVGIRIFANALASVAALNGIDPEARSWRHGSIRRRISFVEGLEARPDAERKFQTGVIRLRLVLGLVLGAACAMAAAVGALSELG